MMQQRILAASAQPHVDRRIFNLDLHVKQLTCMHLCACNALRMLVCVCVCALLTLQLRKLAEEKQALVPAEQQARAKALEQLKQAGNSRAVIEQQLSERMKELDALRSTVANNRQRVGCTPDESLIDRLCSLRSVSDTDEARFAADDATCTAQAARVLKGDATALYALARTARGATPRQACKTYDMLKSYFLSAAETEHDRKAVELATHSYDSMIAELKAANNIRKNAATAATAAATIAACNTATRAPASTALVRGASAPLRSGSPPRVSLSQPRAMAFSDAAKHSSISPGPARMGLICSTAEPYHSLRMPEHGVRRVTPPHQQAARDRVSETSFASSQPVRSVRVGPAVTAATAATSSNSALGFASDDFGVSFPATGTAVAGEQQKRRGLTRMTRVRRMPDVVGSFPTSSLSHKRTASGMLTTAPASVHPNTQSESTPMQPEKKQKTQVGHVAM